MATILAGAGLWFLGDPELVRIVRSTLRELDDAVDRGLPRSTVFLASSALEGMVAYMKRRLPKRPAAGGRARMPDVKKDLAAAVDRAIPYLPGWFPEGFNYLWPFRNHVHALNEFDKGRGRTIDESTAQLAVALVAAYLGAFSSRRFIEELEWQVVTGEPEYHRSLDTIELPVAERPAHSFLVLAEAPRQPFEVSFDVTIPANGIFNIVYNYGSNRDFRMIRIDKRSGLQGIHEGALVCDDWFHWTVSEPHGLDPAIPPETLQHAVTLRAGVGQLTLEIDDKERRRPNGAQWEFDSSRPIGFFNEEVRVTLSRFRFRARRAT